MPINNSILTSTKKNCGLAEDYTVFDPDIIMFINSAFSTLHQLGLGPDEGYSIEDASAEWSDFFDDDRLNSIKNYVYLKTKILFDPPATSYVLTALQEQIKELEWRLNVVREGDDWVDPDPGRLDEGYTYIIDGGGA